jgi:hypothetical protein
MIKVGAYIAHNKYASKNVTSTFAVSVRATIRAKVTLPNKPSRVEERSGIARLKPGVVIRNNFGDNVGEGHYSGGSED